MTQTIEKEEKNTEKDPLEQYAFGPITVQKAIDNGVEFINIGDIFGIDLGLDLDGVKIKFTWDRVIQLCNLSLKTGPPLSRETPISTIIKAFPLAIRGLGF